MVPAQRASLAVVGPMLVVERVPQELVVRLGLVGQVAVLAFPYFRVVVAVPFGELVVLEACL